LSTTPVTVRPATCDDAGPFSAIYASMVLDTAVSFEDTPPGAAELERRMSARPRLPWLVAESNEGVVGYAYAVRHRERAAYRWCADSSVYVDPAHHGRGVGRLLYARLVAEVRDLGYVNLFAGIALPNDASVGLHEAAGFTPVGVYRDVGFKHGSWRDVGWWQLSLADPPASPAEPREWLSDA
jgi:L-amino acid N-acyltransferase YncA